MSLPAKLASFKTALFSPRVAVQAATTSRLVRHFSMKGARVMSWGSAPEYVDLPDLPTPLPTQLRLRVLAVGVPRVVQARAAGQHPTVANQPLPFDPSIDGVGRDEATGDIYFISTGAAPVLSEYVNVERARLIKLRPGADPVAVAGLANTAQASWIAFRCRVLGGLEGRTVVILGATSKSGRCAVKVARILGAKTVVGISRDAETLARVDGLDERVVLADPLTDTLTDPLTVLPSTLGPVHVILDFVGGPAAVQLMQAAQVDPGSDLQYILAGWLSGSESLTIPARLLNSKPVRIMGSGMGSVSMRELAKEMSGFVDALSSIGTPPFEVFKAPLSEVQSVWNSEDAKTKRLVLVP